MLRPDLTIDLHVCWFFCSLKKRMLQKSKQTEYKNILIKIKEGKCHVLTK